jgi:hypothetical protein
MGCSFSTTLPSGHISVNHCTSIPLNPSLQLSEVTINGVPSNWGAFSTGSDVRIVLSWRNDLVCVVVQMLAS